TKPYGDLTIHDTPVKPLMAATVLHALDVHLCLLTVFYVGGPLCDNHSAVTAISLLYPNPSPDFN
ncbi:hypothetical protein ACU48O_005043, partial [Escherichia coli]